MAASIIIRTVVNSPTSPTLIRPFIPEKGVYLLVQLIDMVKCLLASVVIWVV